MSYSGLRCAHCFLQGAKLAAFLPGSFSIPFALPRNKLNRWLFKWPLQHKQ
jgi:hypothetical protein